MRKESMGNNTHMELGEHQPEYNPAEANWSDLSNHARVENNPHESLKDLQEMRNRIDAAKHEGAIDVREVQTLILDATDNSGWKKEAGADFYYDKLKKVGKDYDADSEGTHGGDYAEDPKTAGMVGSITDAIAKQISATAMLNVGELHGKPRDQWEDADWIIVGQKMRPGWSPANIQEIKDLYERNERYASVDFAGLVGLKVDDLIKSINDKTPAQKIEEQRKQEKDENQRLIQQRAEYPQRSQITGQPVKAAFKGSTLATYGVDTKVDNPQNEGEDRKNMLKIRDLKVETDRKKWVRDQMWAYAHGQGSNLAANWQRVHSLWVDTDLKNALEIATLNMSDADKQDLEAEVRKTEKEITMWLSVAATGECMFASGGAGTDAMKLLLGATDRGGVNTDNVDIIKDEKYLLQEHAEVYDTVRSDVDVRREYDNLLGQMGITFERADDFDIDQDKDKNIDIEFTTSGNIKRRFNPTTEKGDKTQIRTQIRHVDIGDIKTFRGSSLYKSLDNGTFDQWIEADLKREDDNGVAPAGLTRDERWLNKKMAVYLIMTDGKWTQWISNLNELEAEHAGNKDYKDLTKDLKPSKNWGGDILATMDKSSTLVRDIKGMYRGKKDGAVLDISDEAFNPKKYGLKESWSKTSLVGTGTKTQVRQWDAIFTYGGDPRGSTIASWDKDGVANFQRTVELIDTINGRSEEGKKLTAYQVMTLLHSKALASVLQTPEPYFWSERILQKLVLPDDSREMPHGGELTFLLGPALDGRAGYLSEVLGARMRIKIDGAARGQMRKALSLLKSNDQNDFMRGMGEILTVMGIAIDLTYVLAQIAAEGAGVELPMPQKKKRG
jgi:hypothetical protein